MLLHASQIREQDGRICALLAITDELSLEVPDSLEEPAIMNVDKAEWVAGLRQYLQCTKQYHAPGRTHTSLKDHLQTNHSVKTDLL